MATGPERYTTRISHARDGFWNGLFFRTPAWAVLTFVGSERLGIHGLLGKSLASLAVTVASATVEGTIFNRRVRSSNQIYSKNKVCSPDESGYALF